MGVADAQICLSCYWCNTDVTIVSRETNVCCNKLQNFIIKFYKKPMPILSGSKSKSQGAGQ